jgi:hypothetical protein
MLPDVNEPAAPPDIVALARQRAEARGARHWRTADDLKLRIEAAGWKVVDEGLRFRLLPARPPDLVDGERRCAGSPDAVPSLADEPDRPGACIIVVVATGGHAAVAETLATLRRHVPADTTLLAVAPCEVQPEELADASEVVWTALTFTAGAAIRAAMRRATNETVVVVDPAARAIGDLVSPLVAALADPSVALAAADGRRSADLWHYEPAVGDVTCAGPTCYAVRRRDALERGDLDDRLVLAVSVATWWSLLLRDEGPDRAPRRAVVVDVPLASVPNAGGTVDGPSEGPISEHDRRAERRDAYRIGERFREHTWLAAHEEVADLPGEWPRDDDDDHDPQQGGDATDLSQEHRPA